MFSSVWLEFMDFEYFHPLQFNKHQKIKYKEVGDVPLFTIGKPSRGALRWSCTLKTCCGGLIEFLWLKI
jgi:hypothetical protein